MSRPGPVYLQDPELAALLHVAARTHPADAELIQALCQGQLPVALHHRPAQVAFEARLQQYAAATDLPTLRVGRRFVTIRTLRRTAFYRLVRGGARCCTIQEYLARPQAHSGG